ncbi:MAG: peroxiredoxin [Tepidamorphaceae bacterium]|nr:peroxiredoxin [Rhodobiaceae bacterium]MCC0048962.1 peroxiredoxin [Rhodobiaceae bacterium]
MVKVGEHLPEAEFPIMTDDGMVKRSASDIFYGRKVVMFAVPGAFTGTCQNVHVPGFLKNVDAFKAKGVDEVFCLAVNDPFVLAAWAKEVGTDGKITLLSDGNGTFTKALDMSVDLSAAGLGERSKRYAMLIEDGVVTQLNVEDSPGKAEISSAETLLGQM